MGSMHHLEMLLLLDFLLLALLHDPLLHHVPGVVLALLGSHLDHVPPVGLIEHAGLAVVGWLLLNLQ
jgi:hypothetical protein